MPYFVYIMSDDNSETIAINVCNNLARKVLEIKRKNTNPEKEKRLTKLIYFEVHPKHSDAVARDKVMRHWEDGYLRKIISFQNPQFTDITDRVFAQYEMFENGGLIIK